MDTLSILGDRERSLGLPERTLLAAMDYVLDERVVDGVSQANRLAARVIGARDDYRAEVEIEPLDKARCSCGRHQPCRHAAAVALAFLRRPDAFQPLPPDLPLTDAVFALVAGRDDPLAPLHRGDDAGPAKGQGAGVDVEGLSTLPSASALKRLAAWLEDLVALSASALDGEDAQRAARLLSSLPSGERVEPALARRFMRVYLRLEGGPLGAALSSFLHSLEHRPLEAAAAAAEHAVWAAVDSPERGGDEAVRAMAWLCDHAQAEGGAAAVAATARAHRGAPWAGVYESEALLALGQAAAAARRAQAAYLHARGDESVRLYELLVNLGRKGIPGVAAFLRAAWEADPDERGLTALLGMGDVGEREAMRRAAVVVLGRRHRYDLLTRLSLEEDDLVGAARWAARDGGHAADAGMCRDLAERLADDQPLAAIELLGAAYRRTGEPDARRQVLARARTFARRASVGAGWHTLRRRWFPERLASEGEGASVGRL